MVKPDTTLPLKGIPEIPERRLAPAWLALLTAWLGLVMLIASIVFVFLPGSQSPKEELEGMRQYSWADRFLPIPIYGVTVTIFLGIVVLRQMNTRKKPLPDGLVQQKAQAWVGIVLALLAAVVIYVWVGLRGPK